MESTYSRKKSPKARSDFKSMLSSPKGRTPCNIEGPGTNLSTDDQGAVVSPKRKVKGLNHRRMQYKLSGEDITQIADLWTEHVGSTTDTITSTDQLIAMVHAMHIQVYDAILRFFSESFDDAIHNGRVSYVQFCVLLERSKEFHDDYLEANPHVKDDLLDAFIAVGGLQDTTGFVDVGTMQRLMSDFHLRVDVHKIVEEVDNDGDLLVDFDEFTSLLRGSDALVALSESKENVLRTHPSGMGGEFSGLGNSGSFTTDVFFQPAVPLPLSLRTRSFHTTVPSNRAAPVNSDSILARLEAIGNTSLASARRSKQVAKNGQSGVALPRAPEFYRRVLAAVGDAANMVLLRDKVGLMMKKVDRTGQPKIYSEDEIATQRKKKGAQHAFSCHMHSAIRRREVSLNEEPILPSETTSRTPAPHRQCRIGNKVLRSPYTIDPQLSENEERSESPRSNVSSESSFATSSEDESQSTSGRLPSTLERERILESSKSQLAMSDSMGASFLGATQPSIAPTKPLSAPTVVKPVASCGIPGLVMSLPNSEFLLPSQTFIGRKVGRAEEAGARRVRGTAMREGQVNRSLVSGARRSDADHGTPLVYSGDGKTRNWEKERRNPSADGLQMNSAGRRKNCNQDDYGLKRNTHDTKLFEQYLGVDSAPSNNSSRPDMSVRSDRVVLTPEQQARVMLQMHNVSQTEQLMLVHKHVEQNNLVPTVPPAWKGRLQLSLKNRSQNTASPTKRIKASPPKALPPGSLARPPRGLQ